MIEYYYRFFTNNFKTKIKQLITDVDRLLSVEGIKLATPSESYLDSKYGKRLSTYQWDKLNRLYFTLDHNLDKLSPVLKKFKNEKSKQQLKQFSFIDTFAGCGGLSLGLSQAGFSPVLINEIEPRFLETYYFNHDIHIDKYFCGDIQDLVSNDVTLAEYNEVDLVVGGPPCQGFSMANRQRVLDDPRNRLYRFYLELLHKVRPKFFVMENVKGMMNKSKEILDDFHTIIGDEYSIEMTLLNAKDYGIPQNRERVFVIGSRVKGVTAQNIVSDILTSRNKMPKFVLKDAIGDLPTLKPKREKNKPWIENDDVGYKFRPYKYMDTDYRRYIAIDNNNHYLMNHTNRFNNDRDIMIFDRLPQGANSLHKSIVDIMPYSSRNHMFKDKFFKLSECEVSKTITSHMKLDCNMYIHPNQPRGLSPREAARIQTFPDDYTFMGANNIWYAQIGNAVPVKLAQIIGEAIVKHLN